MFPRRRGRVWKDPPVTLSSGTIGGRYVGQLPIHRSNFQSPEPVVIVALSIPASTEIPGHLVRSDRATWTEEE